MTERELHLTPKEAAERLGFALSTLANWRVRGYGPRYIKVSSRILYPEREIKAFFERNLRSSTSEKVDD